jgi:hypothetical protein
MADPAPEPSGPLVGLRVVELGGPNGQYCGKLRADMGADVLKVEPPAGDPARGGGPYVDDVPDPNGSRILVYATNGAPQPLNAQQPPAFTAPGQPQIAQPRTAAGNAVRPVVRAGQPVEDTLACEPQPITPWCGAQPVLPPVCCLPPPAIDLSGAPAGRGLETNPQGWPANTVATAGGYHIVGDGNTKWRIFEPGQNVNDEAASTTSGDPHVHDHGGVNWDFSKSSDFVLGDGTRIFARTSAETGQSITVALDIVNGADHVTMSDIDKATKMGGVAALSACRARSFAAVPRGRHRSTA